MKREVGAPKAAGFTIIEVMLFLAISGALVVALLVTVGTTISRQRFSDSINSTQAFVQQQVNETLNVVNDRENNGGCSVGSGTTVIGGGTTGRGASDCVVLGRALDFTPDSETVKTYPVVGYEPDTTTGTGAALLASYRPSIDTANGVNYDIAWSQKVSGIHPSGVTRVLLLRSPDSGSVLTFGGMNVQDALSAGARAINICFKAGDIAGTTAMVSLANISGSEGITTRFDIPSDEAGALCS